LFFRGIGQRVRRSGNLPEGIIQVLPGIGQFRQALFEQPAPGS
jgi:hypothetical protein